MRINSLQQFVRLRQELSSERERLQVRLREINAALGEMPAPSSPVPSQPARRGRRAAGSGQSLREHVLAVLQGGPQTKEEVLSAVQARGYKFSTSNPLNSLGVILYGKNPKFKRVDGRFSLAGGPTVASTSLRRGAGPGRRTMSAAGRARIAAAQKARWAGPKNSKPSAAAYR